MKTEKDFFYIYPQMRFLTNITLPFRPCYAGVPSNTGSAEEYACGSFGVEDGTELFRLSIGLCCIFFGIRKFVGLE